MGERKKRFEASHPRTTTFDGAVVDTMKSNSIDGDYVICECYEQDDAEIIAAALNEAWWHDRIR